MATDLRIHVETSARTAAQITARTRLIYDTVLQESPSLDRGNFTTIHPADLTRLFDLYDAGFLGLSGFPNAILGPFGVLRG